MHNLKANFDKFIGLSKSFFSDRIKEFGNFQSYPVILKMSKSLNKLEHVLAN